MERIGDRRKIDERRTIGKRRRGLPGRLEREPRLANPAWASQRQQRRRPFQEKGAPLCDRVG